jgi:hypothetical protein
MRPVRIKTIELPSTKGAPSAQYVQGLEQAGLTRGIRAADQRELRIEFDLCRMQAPEIRYLNPPQGHPFYNLMGMTT